MKLSKLPFEIVQTISNRSLNIFFLIYYGYVNEEIINNYVKLWMEKYVIHEYEYLIDTKYNKKYKKYDRNNEITEEFAEYLNKNNIKDIEDIYLYENEISYIDHNTKYLYGFDNKSDIFRNKYIDLIYYLFDKNKESDTTFAVEPELVQLILLFNNIIDLLVYYNKLDSYSFEGFYKLCKEYMGYFDIFEAYELYNSYVIYYIIKYKNWNLIKSTDLYIIDRGYLEYILKNKNKMNIEDKRNLEKIINNIICVPYDDYLLKKRRDNEDIYIIRYKILYEIIMDIPIYSQYYFSSGETFKHVYNIIDIGAMINNEERIFIKNKYKNKNREYNISLPELKNEIFYRFLYNSIILEEINKNPKYKSIINDKYLNSEKEIYLIKKVIQYEQEYTADRIKYVLGFDNCKTFDIFLDITYSRNCLIFYFLRNKKFAEIKNYIKEYYSLNQVFDNILILTFLYQEKITNSSHLEHEKLDNYDPYIVINIYNRKFKKFIIYIYITKIRYDCGFLTKGTIEASIQFMFIFKYYNEIIDFINIIKELIDEAIYETIKNHNNSLLEDPFQTIKEKTNVFYMPLIFCAIAANIYMKENKEEEFKIIINRINELLIKYNSPMEFNNVEDIELPSYNDLLKENKYFDDIIKFLNNILKNKDRTLNSGYDFNFYNNKNVSESTKSFQEVTDELLLYSEKFSNLTATERNDLINNHLDTYTSIIKLLMTSLLNKWSLSSQEQINSDYIYARNTILFSLEAFLDIDIDISIGTLNLDDIKNAINVLSYEIPNDYNKYLNLINNSTLSENVDSQDLQNVSDIEYPYGFDHQLSLALLGVCKFNEFSLENTNKYNIYNLYKNGNSGFITSDRFIFSVKDAFSYYSYAGQKILNQHIFYLRIFCII
ncbi:hypothetical protein H8356DRAFT_1065683 [Neocallimastix lanati (nom. inval.)]|nr:hypothetical protein H8356DRAFT_1065683 [Neocallimastix sp. JGI-2020a]